MQAKQQEYEVNLALFEGPLDLLLYLVNKSEVNIIDISVSEVAMQYIQYLEMIRELNIDIASEYLHMAATLVRLKARELLPPQEGEELDQEDGIYNREQLIQQLLEYKKFKEAASTLKIFEAEQFGAFTRGRAEAFETAGDEQGIDLGNISVFDLLTAFKRILERTDDVEDEYKHVVNVDSVNIDDRIEHILSQLTEHEEVLFDDLFVGDTRKMMVVVTFMAILELVKMQEIGFRQEVNFGPIFVCRKKDNDITHNKTQSSFAESESENSDFV